RVERGPARAGQAHLRADRRGPAPARPLGRGVARGSGRRQRIFGPVRGEEVNACTDADITAGPAASAAAGATRTQRRCCSGSRRTSATWGRGRPTGPTSSAPPGDSRPRPPPPAHSLANRPRRIDGAFAILTATHFTGLAKWARGAHFF